jgi:hypothetical protein
MLGQDVRGFAGGIAGPRCHHLPIAFGKAATRRASTRSALEASPSRFVLLRYSRPGPARKSLSKPCSFAPPMIRLRSACVGAIGVDCLTGFAAGDKESSSRRSLLQVSNKKRRLSSDAAIPTRGSRAKFRTAARKKSGSERFFVCPIADRSSWNLFLQCGTNFESFGAFSTVLRSGIIIPRWKMDPPVNDGNWRSIWASRVHDRESPHIMAQTQVPPSRIEWLGGISRCIGSLQLRSV